MTRMKMAYLLPLYREDLRKWNLLVHGVPLPSAAMLCWYQLASLGAAWKWTVHVENLHLMEVLNGYRASHSLETGGTVTSGQKWENVPPQEWHLRKRVRTIVYITARFTIDFLELQPTGGWFDGSSATWAGRIVGHCQHVSTTISDLGVSPTAQLDIHQQKKGTEM
ncbi:uncharacterized protein LOC111333309 [Stylophora pistillata]|uniref:uncharacterized protein LOC111333309 n=1 Tax=Stylophora pistillata TaxID=50429 RepID=UPI000C04222E|nr:uncharacterized protein LOC111333309 [Stylophora pistillata]